MPETIGPERIVADARDADEEIDVAHHLREDDRVDFVETHRVEGRPATFESEVADRVLPRHDPERASEPHGVRREKVVLPALVR